MGAENLDGCVRSTMIPESRASDEVRAEYMRCVSMEHLEGWASWNDSACWGDGPKGGAVPES